MRQLFQKALVAIVCATFIFACSKNNDDDNPSPKTPEKPKEVKCKVNSLSIEGSSFFSGRTQKYTFTYDANDRVTSYLVEGGEEEKKYDVKYNANNQIERIEQSFENQGFTYYYRTNLIRPNDTLVLIKSEEQYLKYDKVTGKPVGVGSNFFGIQAYSIDDKGRIKGEYSYPTSGGSDADDLRKTYQYDENGNVVKIVLKSGKEIVFSDYDLKKKNPILTNESLRNLLLFDVAFDSSKMVMVSSPYAFGKLTLENGTTTNYTYETNAHENITTITPDVAGEGMPNKYVFDLSCE